jgi:hypothetical protein
VTLHPFPDGDDKDEHQGNDAQDPRPDAGPPVCFEVLASRSEAIDESREGEFGEDEVEDDGGDDDQTPVSGFGSIGLMNVLNPSTQTIVDGDCDEDVGRQEDQDAKRCDYVVGAEGGLLLVA